MIVTDTETIAVAQFDSHRVSRQTDLGFRRATPDTRFGVSVVDDEVDDVGDKVGGVNTSVQCVD